MEVIPMDDCDAVDNGRPTYDDLLREQAMFIGPPEFPQRPKMMETASPEDEAMMKQSRFRAMLHGLWGREYFDPKTATDERYSKDHWVVPSLYAPEP